MNRFVKDNAHLELLHSATSTMLFDEFGSVVNDHANTFDSIIATDFPEGSINFSEPTKYSLKTLDTDCIDVLKKIYCKLYPQYESEIAENSDSCFNC